MGPPASLRRLLDQVMVRVRLVVGRSIVRAVDEATKVRTLQLSALKGETLGKVEHLQHFGFTSRPPLESEAVIVCVMGARDVAIAVAEEHRESRPAGVLAVGEAMIYAVGGARVHVRADGSVSITAPAGVTVSGDLVAGGNLADAIGTLAALRTAYNAHVHSNPEGGFVGPAVPQA